MGNCSTVDGGPCDAQAPMPSSLLWVKVIRVDGIRTPAWLNGDTVRKCANKMIGRPHSIRMYAKISLGKQQSRTEEADVADQGDLVLNQPPLPFTLDSIVANASANSSTRGQLSPPQRNSAGSLASTLLDRRIPEMTVKVYRVRRMCKDAMIGQGVLPISSTELAGTSKEHTIELTNGCGTVTLKCSFNCSLSDLRDLQSVLTAPKKTRSSAQFSRALAQLLQGEDGLQILEKAMPASLVWKCREDSEREQLVCTLQSMLVSLCNHVTMLSERESNSEALKRLAPLSRNIQDFVAEHAPPDEDVSALATEWLSDVFSYCARKTGLKGAMPLDIQDFLDSGARYPGIDHLAPIDSSGRPFQEWIDAPPTVKKEFLPKSAILGQGMFGTVWRAMDLRTKQWYAVKRSHSSSREAFIGRERDVTNHVMMNPHAFVVQIFGNYVVEGSARLSFLVMEFCSRGDLQIRINTAHESLMYRMPVKVPAWMGQIFLGLEHLHLVLDMLVRDLKPANVVFSGHDHAKLTDFGMGRIGGTSTGAFTLQNCPPGSPAYAAPEVVLQKPYDHKADIYSFGVLCWTMLTGGIKVDGPDWCPPSHKFSAHNFTTLARNHTLLAKAIRNPSQAGAQPLPSEKAVDLILSTTRPDPNQRPGHDRLRAHALFSAMRLPPPEARPHQVDEWLETLSGDTLRSAGSRRTSAGSGTAPRTAG